MAKIGAANMLFIEQLFEMESGYVLNFSNKELARFFVHELNVDLEEKVYFANGSSKANRLRTFLRISEAAAAIRALRALWVYRQVLHEQFGKEEPVKNAQGRFEQLIAEIGGAPADKAPAPASNRPKLQALAHDLQELASISSAQERGYAFERFLKNLFDVSGMEAREAFRLTGEQIDGSVISGSDTYLVEAKWQNALTGAADLHVLEGKLQQKAAWARGLFISYSGFTEDGLAAFGKGKKVICLDGLDLHDALARELPIKLVIDRKARRAVETGQAFVRVRDLFPV